MADQRPWWKLWVSALSDDDLEGLTLEDWARWARLGTHVKMHGDHGRLPVPYPGTSLRNTLRTPLNDPQKIGQRKGWDALIRTLRRIPGITLDVSGHGDDERIVITFKNWRKYQEDRSADRTREWRKRQKERDGGEASHGDGRKRHAPPPPPSQRDDVEEIRSRREPPIPPSHSNGSTDRFTLPREGYNTDCPIDTSRGRLQDWRGHCVNGEYVRDHPGHTFPVSDANGTPKQCPHHRDLEPAW